MTTVGQEAIQSFGELSGKESSQPIDGSSKLEERKLKFEEYKLWVEDLSRISDRRGNRTGVYVAINSFVFTAIALFLRGFDLDATQRGTLLLLFPFIVIGITTCLSWYQTMLGFLKLVDLRINLLREIEKLPEINLSVKAFHAEHELYSREEPEQDKPRDNRRFSLLANLELGLPIVLLAIYFILLVGISTLVIGV